MMTTLRATLYNLAMAVTAYYVIRHRTIEVAGLDMQNFCLSVHFCVMKSAAPVSEAELVQLLAVGIDIVEEDEAASTGNVMAALAEARRVLDACTPATVAP